MSRERQTEERAERENEKAYLHSSQYQPVWARPTAPAQTSTNQTEKTKLLEPASALSIFGSSLFSSFFILSIFPFSVFSSPLPPLSLPLCLCFNLFIFSLSSQFCLLCKLPIMFSARGKRARKVSGDIEQKNLEAFGSTRLTPLTHKQVKRTDEKFHCNLSFCVLFLFVICFCFIFSSLSFSLISVFQPVVSHQQGLLSTEASLLVLEILEEFTDHYCSQVILFSLLFSLLFFSFLCFVPTFLNIFF